MNTTSLPTQEFRPGVRCAEAQRFEDRYPRIRFMTAPEGGDGGAGGSGGDAGADDKLGEGGKKALDAERTARADADRRATAAEARAAEAEKKNKEFEDGKLTAEQRAQRDAETSTARTSQLETDNATLLTEVATLKTDYARLLVAITEGVPAEWAERIKGATPEEMTADAKKIKGSLRDSGDRTPGAGELGSDVKPTTTPGFGTLAAGYAASSNK